jgi:hypothetical protein
MSIIVIRIGSDADDLRHQQRRKKLSHYLTFNLGLGVDRHKRLSLEPISAFPARPKVEDESIANIFGPFSGDQGIAASIAGHRRLLDFIIILAR